MVANTWIAAAPGDWSDDANWSLGHKPIAGEDPTFDGTSVNNCNANDATPTGVLTIAAGYSGTITQSSDMYISGYSQAGGTFTGVITKWVYLSGNALKTGGTFTAAKTNLNFTADLSFNINGVALANIDVIGNVTVTGQIILSSTGIFKNYGIVNFNTVGDYLDIRRYTDSPEEQILNYGVINCNSGSVKINLYNADRTLPDMGIINGNLIIQTYVAIANRICTLDNSVVYSNTVLSIVSTHATYTCTLDLNGHSLTASSITVGTRGILQCGEGTIITKALNSSAGTIAEETATWIFERGSTIKVAAAQKLYNVIAKGSSALKLLSNLGISGLFAHPAEIDRNGFTLTLDQPDKEYAGLRRPIIVPVKKLDIGEVGLLDGWLRDLGGLLR